MANLRVSSAVDTFMQSANQSEMAAAIGIDGEFVIDALSYTPANDANVVHKSGTETVVGAKTFSNTIVADYGISFNSNADLIGPSKNYGWFLIQSNTPTRIVGSGVDIYDYYTGALGLLNAGSVLLDSGASKGLKITDTKIQAGQTATIEFAAGNAWDSGCTVALRQLGTNTLGIKGSDSSFYGEAGHLVVGRVLSTYARTSTKSNIEIADVTSGFSAGLGGEVVFSGDDRGQGVAGAVFAGMRGIKENSTYLNQKGALLFLVNPVAALDGSVGDRSTLVEAGRFGSDKSFTVGGDVLSSVGSGLQAMVKAISGSGGFIEMRAAAGTNFRSNTEVQFYNAAEDAYQDLRVGTITATKAIESTYSSAALGYHTRFSGTIAANSFGVYLNSIGSGDNAMAYYSNLGTITGGCTGYLAVAAATGGINNTLRNTNGPAYNLIWSSTGQDAYTYHVAGSKECSFGLDYSETQFRVSQSSDLNTPRLTVDLASGNTWIEGTFTSGAVSGTNGSIQANAANTNAYAKIYGVNSDAFLKLNSGSNGNYRGIRFGYGASTEDWSFGYFSGLTAGDLGLYGGFGAHVFKADGSTEFGGAITATGQHVFNSGVLTPTGTVTTFQTIGCTGGFSEWRFRHQVTAGNDNSLYIGNDGALTWIKPQPGNNFYIKSGNYGNIASFKDDLSTDFGGPVTTTNGTSYVELRAGASGVNTHSRLYLVTAAGSSQMFNWHLNGFTYIEGTNDILFRPAGVLAMQLGNSGGASIYKAGSGAVLYLERPGYYAAGFEFNSSNELTINTGAVKFTGSVESTFVRQSTEPTAAPSGTTQTVTLNNGNYQTVALTSTTGDTTITLTVPSGPSAGSLIIKQHGTTARDITWTVSAGAIIWLGTEPTWNADAVSSYRVVQWRYDGSTMFLEASASGS